MAASESALLIENKNARRKIDARSLGRGGPSRQDWREHDPLIRIIVTTVTTISDAADHGLLDHGLIMA